MSPRDLAGDGKSQPCAAPVSCPAVVEPYESLEHAVSIRSRDSGSVADDVDLRERATGDYHDLNAGQSVTLTMADVLDLDLGRTFDVWHDRAVFHFLTEKDEREDYRSSLDRHTDSGSWAVVATFGPDGPTHCSGLPIGRYGHDDLAAEFPG